MCGINGIIRRNGDAFPDLLKMNSIIAHRGPDSAGTRNFAINDLNIAVGMVRLSIIDIKGGQQPIESADGKTSVFFNGEIYNYLELKRQLESDNNVKFTTSSDTEVIFHLYRVYGERCFEFLEGMYAISIVDRAKQNIFLARDYFGEKPLYYSCSDGEIIWSSELKALKQVIKNSLTVDLTAVNTFFQLSYIPAPNTIYNEVQKISPNTCLTIDLKSLRVSESVINKYNKRELDNSISINDAVVQTRNLVTKSVEMRGLSDVPVGTFLSGGVDSSIVSLIHASKERSRVKTFSIGFDNKKYDESLKAKTVADLINSDHHNIVLQDGDLKSVLDKVLEQFDEPFADSSALPTYLVSKLAANSVKVVLTGDGGDEVFAGYNKHYMNRVNKEYTRLVHPTLHNILKESVFLNLKNDNRGYWYKLKRLLNSISYEGDFYTRTLSLGFQKEELHFLLKQKEVRDYCSTWNTPSNLYECRQIDRKYSLEGDLLVKVDRMTMMNSIESRSPFLDRSLWNFSNSLPDEFLIKRRSKKYLLKEAFKDDFPAGFLEKSKKGFSVPIGDWLRGSLRNELEQLTSKSFLEKQNLFSFNYIANLKAQHHCGKSDHSFQLWTLYVFQKWYVNNIQK